MGEKEGKRTIREARRGKAVKRELFGTGNIENTQTVIPKPVRKREKPALQKDIQQPQSEPQPQPRSKIEIKPAERFTEEDAEKLISAAKFGGDGEEEAKYEGKSESLLLAEMLSLIDDKKNEKISEVKKYEAGEQKHLLPLERFLFDSKKEYALKMIESLFSGRKDLEMKNYPRPVVFKIKKLLAASDNEIESLYHKVIKEKSESIKERNGKPEESGPVQAPEQAENNKREDEVRIATMEESEKYFSERKEKGDSKLEKMEDVLRRKTQEAQEKIDREKKLEADIAKAENFEELIEIIKKCDGIYGSEHIFSAEELVEAINFVRRKGKSEIAKITSSLGLRDKVSELLLKEEKEKEKAKKEAAWREFQERYKEHADFISEKEDYFDDEKNFIHFISYDGEKIEVVILDSKIGRKRRRVNLDEFDELLKIYKKKVPDTDKKKMEDVESDRAKVAQEKINKEEFEYYRDPNKNKKHEQEQAEIDEAAENEMGDRISMEKEKEEEKDRRELDEVSEKEMGDRVRMDNEKEMEKENEERARKIEQIKAELEQARKEYLEVDYKKNKAYSRLYKFFGRTFGNKNNEEKNLENDQDIAWYRAHYDNKLMDYKNALLEDAKERGTAEKELSDIVKIFETEARINMSDGHDQVKVEHHEGKFSNEIKACCDKMIRGYKDLPWKQKIAVSIAFGVAGVGAVATGSAFLVGGVATAATIKRFFLGTVTGTSAALYAETKTQKNREKAVEKETVDFIGQSVDLKPEEIEKLFQEKVNSLIYDGDQKINTIKNKNLRNLAIGVGVGTISAIAIPQIFKHAKEWLGFAPHGANIPGHGTGAGNITEHSAGPKVPAGETYTENTHPSGAAPTPQSEIAPSPEASGAMEVPKEKILTVGEYHTGKSGGTFEGTIKKYLMEEKNFDNTEAGKQATILRQNWESLHPDSHNYDLVHEGDQIKIELDSNGNPYVVDFETADHSGNGGQFSADAVADAKAAPGSYEEMNIQENPKEFSTDEFQGTKSAVPENLPGVDAKNPFDYKTAAGVAVAGGIGGAAIAGRIKMAKESKIIKLPGKKEQKERVLDKMIHDYNFNRNDDFYSRARKIIKILSLEKLENWKKIKDVKFKDWEKDEKLIDPKLAKNIKELENNLLVILGKSAKHKKKENVGQWVARITQSSIKKQMI